MRTDELQYLITISKTNSINKAAQKLNISQQTIRTGLKNLENELNTKLLNRDTAGTTLTESGRLILASAKKILQEETCLKASLAQMASTCTPQRLSGHLNIATTPSIGTTLMPHLVEHFHQTYPHISLSLVEDDIMEIIELISASKADIGFIVGVESVLLQLDKRQLKYFTHSGVSICAFVSKHHPLAQKKSISLQTALKYPLALFRPGINPTVLEEMLKQHGHCKISMVSNNVQVCVGAVNDEQSILFLVRIPSNDNFPDITYIDNNNAVLIPISDFPKTLLVAFLNTTLTVAKRELVTLFLSAYKPL